MRALNMPKTMALVLVALALGAAAALAASPTGIVRVAENPELLQIEIELPEGRGVTALLPARSGEFVEIRTPLDESTYRFRAETSGWVEISRVERAADGQLEETPLDRVRVGAPFALGGAEGPAAKIAPASPKMWDEAAGTALSTRVVKLRIRPAGEKEWVQAGAVEGEFFRLEDPARGTGLGLVPVFGPAGGVTLHLYRLELTSSAAPAFLRLMTLAPGEISTVETPIGGYEIELLGSAAPAEQVSFLQPTRLSPETPQPVDNTQCWINCFQWTAHGCMIWSCGIHCCGSRCCDVL